MTNWLDYLLNIWPFVAIKICQSIIKILPNTTHTLNKLPKMCKISTNGDNWPNLVTLTVAQRSQSASESLGTRM